ncbi:MAG: DMT family transporter [Pseudomonadota bacterium]
MERKDRIDAVGAFWLVSFSALLGLNQVLVKVMNGALQPVFQAGLRSALALPVVLLLAYFLRSKLTIRDGSLPGGVLCGLLFAGEFILLFLALDYTTVARTSIFFYTMPFWVALAAHFLIPGERLTAIRSLGLALAMAGVVLALLDQSAPASPYAFWGDIMCLIGAMMWAGIALSARLTNLSRSTPFMQLVYQLAVSAPVVLLVALFFGPLIREFQPHHAAIFSFQVIVIVSLGFAGWFWLLAKYPASDMASFGFLAPVFGVLFGWLILQEPVGIRLVVALTLVAVGIVLVNRKPKARAEVRKARA